MGEVAYQLLEQLTSIHKQDIVYKYLSPKHIRVTGGFHDKVESDAIKLSIKDLALMQLLDCRGATALDDKICGSNRIFFAPEIKDEAAKVTPLADVWSLGAILYVLIANSVVGD